MKRKLLLMTMFAASIAISSCKNNEKNTAASSSDSTRVANDSTMMTVYACPMDPEITSNEPAKCSKCGMDLVIKNQ